jgi:hypothetical protein
MLDAEGRWRPELLDHARGTDLFAYLEVDDFAAFRASMSASPANDRWQAEMAAPIDPMTDPETGFHQRLEESSTSSDQPSAAAAGVAGASRLIASRLRRERQPLNP